MSDWMYTHNAVNLLDLLYTYIYRNLDRFLKGRISKATFDAECERIDALMAEWLPLIREAELVLDQNPKHPVPKRYIPRTLETEVESL